MIIVGKFVAIKNNQIISEKNIPLKVKVDISENAIEKIINSCRTNYIIGIRGNIDIDENNNIKIIANKVSYISNKKS